MEYELAHKKIKEKGKSNSEIEVNLLLLNLDLDFIDCNKKIKRGGEKDLGEIDGLFKYKDRFLFIIEVDESKKVSSEKQSSFFSKWSDKKNQEILLKNYDLPSTLEIIKIFMCFNQKRIDKPSIKHQIEEKSNILFYKEDWEYFYKNYNSIGSWTRNDFFYSLNLHKKRISEEIDAIRIFLGGKRAYLCAIKVYDLLDSCYIQRKRESGEEGFQRMIKLNKISQIKKGIENSNIIAFPNSIILNASKNLEDNTRTVPGPCKIHFPMDFCSNIIIDGQHRLLGFSKVDQKIQKEYYLPIVIFEDLNKETEIKTFIDINNTQKKIDPNLLLVLKSDFNWEEGSKLYLESLAVSLLMQLNKTNSFLRDRIYFGYNESKKDKITLTTLVGALLRNNLIGGRGFLLEKEIEPIKELNSIFNGIKSNFKEYVDIRKRGFFVSNRGIGILFRLVQFFIRNKKKGKIEKNQSYHLFFEKVASLIDETYIEKLDDYYGEGGVNKACEKILKDLKKIPSYKKIELNLKKI